MKISIEAKRGQLLAQLKELASRDPWSLSARIRPEKLESVLNCLSADLPDHPTSSDITAGLQAIKARGDGTPFLSVGEAHETLTKRQSGEDKVAPPLAPGIKSRLPGLSGAAKLEVANELAHQQMQGAKK
jgi:hypothetical protein